MTLSVGSWPGADFNNAYVGRFCESLETTGISVVSILDPFRAISKEIDVLHMHWPEKVFWGVGRWKSALGALTVLIGLIVLKIKGVKIVWTVHNLEPHDSGNKFMWFWRPYIWGVTLLIDGFVTLCPSTVQIARDRFANLALKPGVFLWHPDYKVPEYSVRKRAEWRKKFGIGIADKVFLFIGQIRPYKGVKELIECFAKVQDTSRRLLIAGSIYNEQLKTKLQRYAAVDSRIILHLQYLSEDELAITALAADVIVLPFRKSFHSGSIIYALSAGRPVITPSSPFSNDLLAHVGEDWLDVYAGPFSPKSFGVAEMPNREKPDLKFLSITESGAKAKIFYLSLCT